MTVLQQEEAKNFFKENDDKSLYQFFQRGSMLDAIAQTNKKTKTEIALMDTSMKVKGLFLADWALHELSLFQIFFSLPQSAFH